MLPRLDRLPPARSCLQNFYQWKWNRKLKFVLIYLPWKSNKAFSFALRYCYPATILADFCSLIVRNFFGYKNKNKKLSVSKVTHQMPINMYIVYTLLFYQIETLKKWALSSFAFQSSKGFIGTLNKKIFKICVRDFWDITIYPLLSTWISTWTKPETYFE